MSYLHHRLVPVVDHLLVPAPLVEHPDNDEPVLVAGGQLLVSLVPPDDLDLPVVPL